MQTNKERTMVLVENPHTGNEAFGRAMGMAPFRGLDRWAKPAACREKLKDYWPNATKHVLVRPVQERFESAATRVLAACEKDAAAWPEPFREAAAKVRAKLPPTPAGRGLALLEIMAREGMALPVCLEPQAGWLKARFDLTVSTRDIASYFNIAIRTRSCLRGNRHASDPAKRDLRVRVAGPRAEKLLRTVYAEDFALFERLLVWSPDPARVRLVGGYCASCTEKRAAGKAGMLDLRQEPETDLHEAAKPAAPEPPKQS